MNYSIGIRHAIYFRLDWHTNHFQWLSVGGTSTKLRRVDAMEQSKRALVSALRLALPADAWGGDVRCALPTRWSHCQRRTAANGEGALRRLLLSDWDRYGTRVSRYGMELSCVCLSPALAITSWALEACSQLCLVGRSRAVRFGIPHRSGYLTVTY